MRLIGNRLRSGERNSGLSAGAHRTEVLRIAGAGQALLAGTFIALGILGFAMGDFAPIWQPVPKGVTARTALAYLSALVSLACGIGLLLQRAAAISSRILLGYLVLWMLIFRVIGIFLAPASQEAWSGCGEIAVYVAGAWVVYAWCAGGNVRIGRMLYGLALLPFGVAHFRFVNETAQLIPGWLPAHVPLAYLTGGAYIAAGVAIIFGLCANLAAVLSAVMMGLFTALVWVPIVAAGPNAFQWSEFVISTTLTAGAWVVADSYYKSVSSRTAGTS